jgi:peptide/nickel transport system substrate-binding protein
VADRGLGILKARMTRRSFFQFAGGVAGALGGGVLGGETGRALAAPPDTALIIGSNLRIRSLDPARVIDNSTLTFVRATYDSLVAFRGDDLRNPRASLATSWTVSPDGRAYTFKLRPNVQFASGNPLTSADVKWSLERVINLKDITYYFVDRIEEVQAPDPLPVVVRLAAPYPSLISILSSASLGILDSREVTANGGSAGPDAKTKDGAEPYLNAHSLGSGPFILSGYTPSQEVILVKNPRYWRGVSRIDRVVARHIPEPASEQFQLERGELDIATGIGSDQAQALRRAKGVTVKLSLLADTFYVLMNNNPSIGGPFALPKIQQAVRSALDYEGIMKLAPQGAIRLAGVIPTSFAGSLDPTEAVKTDRTKARMLVKEASLGGVRGRLTFSAGFTAWGVQIGLLVQKIQTDLAEVGITIDLNGVAHLTASQEYRDGRSQIGVWYWTADWPDASDFLVYLPGREVGKRAGWPADASPEAAALVRLGEAAEAELDHRKRAALHQRIDRRLMEIGPYAPLFQSALPYAFRSNVRDVGYDRLGILDLYAISKTG